MPTAFSAPYRDPLRERERSPRAKQKEFLERYEFREEPIVDPSDIQDGDHLIRERGLYAHHMLCTEKSHEQVKIIEYTGPAWPGIGASSSGLASKDLTVFGKIEERSYPVAEFLQEKILKIIWPDELKCFSVEEVIRRARSRINETSYDMLKNNCEHFVTWSICGLKVSLQVKSWFVWAREMLYSALVGVHDLIKKKACVPMLIKIAANVSDEAAGFICKNAESIGFGLAILLEAGWASYEICKAFNGHSMKSTEFWAKLVDVVAKALCRLGGGALGSWLGPLLCPAGGLLASLIGGALGAGIGHLIGAFIGWLYENHFFFDG